jgi:hypothetical protein
LLDSDDSWHPAKLRRQMTLFAADPSLEFCFTGILAEGPSTISEIILDHWGDTPDRSLERLLLGCCIATASVVATRRLLLEMGLFDSTLRLGDDYDLFLRIAASGRRMAYVPEALTITGGDVAGISSRAADVSASYERVLKQHFDGGGLPARFVARRRWYWSRRHLNNASYALEQADYGDSIVALFRAFLARPASVRPGWLRMLAQALVGRATGRGR